MLLQDAPGWTAACPAESCLFLLRPPRCGTTAASTVSFPADRQRSSTLLTDFIKLNDTLTLLASLMSTVWCTSVRAMGRHSSSLTGATNVTCMWRGKVSRGACCRLAHQMSAARSPAPLSCRQCTTAACGSPHGRPACSLRQQQQSAAAAGHSGGVQVKRQDSLDSLSKADDGAACTLPGCRQGSCASEWYTTATLATDGHSNLGTPASPRGYRGPGGAHQLPCILLFSCQRKRVSLEHSLQHYGRRSLRVAPRMPQPSAEQV